MTNIHIDMTAQVASPELLGEGVRIWRHATLREGVRVGARSVIGQAVYVGMGVQIGQNCKIQNNALVYEPARLEAGVFLGPSAVLTNDLVPRSVNSDGDLKTADDWESVGVLVGEGASIGAGAVCVAPVIIGPWAMVGAGSVVTADVPSHAMVVGVPARQKGWVGKSGTALVEEGELWGSASDPFVYRIVGGQMTSVGNR